MLLVLLYFYLLSMFLNLCHMKTYLQQIPRFNKYRINPRITKIDDKTLVKIFAFNHSIKLLLRRESFPVKVKLPDRLHNEVSVIRGTVEVDNRTMLMSDVYGMDIDNMFEGYFSISNERFHIENCPHETSCHEIYTHNNLTDIDMLIVMPVKPRFKRRSFNEPVSCGIKIVADHRFYKIVANSNIRRAFSEIFLHYTGVDAVYRPIDFNLDGTPDNFGFILDEVVIFKSETDKGNIFTNRHQSRDLGAADIYLSVLDKFNNSTNYCLQYGFTYINFHEYIVGIAHVGDSINALRGICSRLHNTGIVSFIQDNVKVPRAVSILVFAHELGHSCGSSHDQAGHPQCDGDKISGHYLMSAPTTNAKMSNNYKFSTCSKNLIFPVLVKKGPQCFKKKMGSTCGNGIREHDEECDCGFKDICQDVDKCCVPADSLGERDKPCTLRKALNRTCSPIQSPCCTNECHTVTTRDTLKCHAESACLKASYCDGISHTCPEPKSKKNFIKCAPGYFCQNGECNHTVCELKNLKTCLCPKTKFYCHLCCENSGECLPASQLFPKFLQNEIPYLPAYSLCNGNHGHCNAKHTCIFAGKGHNIDKLVGFFGVQHEETIVKWLSSNWFIIILSLVFCALVSVYFYRTKIMNITVAAKRIGKLTEVMRSIEWHKKRIHKEMNVLTGGNIGQICDKSAALKDFSIRDVDRAYTRLATLFPTAPREEVQHIMVMCTSENVAVKQLLIKFPMSKLITPELYSVYKNTRITQLQKQGQHLPP